MTGIRSLTITASRAVAFIRTDSANQFPESLVARNVIASAVWLLTVGGYERQFGATQQFYVRRTRRQQDFSADSTLHET